MKRTRVVSALLIAALAVGCIFTKDNLRVSATEAQISTDGSDAKTTRTEKIDASDLEDKKQDTLDKIKDIKSDISDVKKKISDLKNSKSNLETYISKLDTEANDLAKQIERLNGDIAAKKEEITAAEGELEEAIATADRQYEDMKKRIQYLYENGNPSYLELLLTSESMADFLNKSSYAEQVTAYDRSMLEEYIAQKQAVEEKKKQLEAEKEELDAMADAAAEQKKTVDALIKTKTAQIQSYQSQIDSENSNAEEYKADLAKQQKLLDQIEQQIAAAAAANAQDGDGDGGASGFLWPCPSSKRITSGFGNRAQPTAGASTNHKGIDIGASYGASIIAAAGGRVTTATYSSSAGNYIVISHGNGLSTVYMHCSALYVSAGQTVSAGQSIAAVGSTGYSTGNHLHFGVIKNGSYVNPLGYVG